MHIRYHFYYLDFSLIQLSNLIMTIYEEKVYSLTDFIWYDISNRTRVHHVIVQVLSSNPQCQKKWWWIFLFSLIHRQSLHLYRFGCPSNLGHPLLFGIQGKFVQLVLDGSILPVHLDHIIHRSSRFSLFQFFNEVIRWTMGLFFLDHLIIFILPLILFFSYTYMIWLSNGRRCLPPLNINILDL